MRLRTMSTKTMSRKHKCTVFNSVLPIASNISRTFRPASYISGGPMGLNLLEVDGVSYENITHPHLLLIGRPI